MINSTNKQQTLNHQATDYEVIQQVLEGDDACYEVIMRRYNQRLYRIARSIVQDDGRAMDVVQEAHIKAYRKLNTFAGSSGFAAWLSTIARNEALTVLRKLKPEKILPFDVHELDRVNGADMNSLDNKPSSPESVVQNRQLRAQLNKHIDALPDIFRTVFIMRGIEQISIRETAQILDINETTVKTRFFRAQQLLRKQLTEQYRESVYEIGGQHCDKIVTDVVDYIRRHSSTKH